MDVLQSSLLAPYSECDGSDKSVLIMTKEKDVVDDEELNGDENDRDKEDI